MDSHGPGPAWGQGEGPAHARAGLTLTLTAERASLARTGALAAVLRDEGYTVERRTFIDTDPTGGPVVLLGLDRPLPDIVALVAPPATRPRVVGTLVGLLFPPAGDAGPATLQLKARGAFVSAPVADRNDLIRALERLPVVTARQDLRAAAVTDNDRERRVVYVEGTWLVEA